MKVDVWSDVMCPWCAVGREQLMTAIDAYEGEIELRWRSFELDVHAPRRVEGDYVQRLADKYGRTKEQAQEMVSQMAERGAAVGFPFDFDRIQPGNTFDAHRLLHLAEERGLQDALKLRLFQAYFQQGKAVGEIEVLVELAVDVGLAEADARALLHGDGYAEQVRGDERLAQQLAIGGVPYFVIDQRVAVNGAQPAEALLDAFKQAADSHEPDSSVSGEVCGDEGCVI